MKFPTKPTYLLILGAEMVVTACSQEDMPGIIDLAENQIVFRTSLPTRALPVDKTTLSTFQVTAFDPADTDLVDENGYHVPLFENVKVDKVTETLFTAAQCRWPGVGKEKDNLTIFAFSPAFETTEDENGEHLFNASRDGYFDYQLKNFKVPDLILEHVDFITAFATGNMEENLYSGITLPFEHQLSRVDVKAWSNNQSCDLEIAGVRIGGISRKGCFNFRAGEGKSYWDQFSDQGSVEFVYDAGDRIVTLNSPRNGDKSTSTPENAISLMTFTRDGANDAMVIPKNYPTGWDFKKDINNTREGLYISVLLRVTDATPTTGIKPEGKQRYPYTDTAYGEDAFEVPVICFEVETSSNTIKRPLYKKTPTEGYEKVYYTDPECTKLYTAETGREAKEFGWAALPVKGEWKAGNIYTYTLDYSYGVGLHDPALTTEGPKAGDAVISDNVIVGFSVDRWNEGIETIEDVPGS